MARRLLLHPGVGRQVKQENPNEVRCVMAALLPILVIIAFVGTIPPPGKAGW